MKKTIIALLALTSIAIAAEAADVLYTSTANGNAADNFEAKGFAFINLATINQTLLSSSSV